MNVLAFIRRCLPQTRRHRLVFSALAFAVLVACAAFFIVKTSKASPRLSFYLLKVGSYFQVSRVVSLTADFDQISRDVMWQLLGTAMQHGGADQIDPRSRAELEKVQKVIFGALSATLPAALNSSQPKDALTNAAEASDLFMSGILPTVLKVNPDLWKEWLKSIKAGNFEMTECRVQSSRAACEIKIHGPNAKDASIVSLWTQSDLLWRLEEVIDIRNLVKAMK